MVDEPVSGTLETRADAGEGERGRVKLWLDALDLAGKHEEDWRKHADLAIDRFRQAEKGRKGSRFNILFANTETTVPALYNSTPIPDVRKRHIDRDNPDEEASQKGAQVLDRALVYNLDSYDFDHVMEGVVFNSRLQGRGCARVRYVPRFAPDDPSEPDTTEETEGVSEIVVAEDLVTEKVGWADIRFSPADTWDELTWIGFRHRVTREQAVEQFGSAIGNEIKLDWVVPGADKQEDKKEAPDIFKRATVWEIWDKEKLEVVFIAPAFKEKPVKVDDDPLKLTDFWPTPRPLYGIEDSDTMVPMVPYDIYRDQAEELDAITARISNLIKVLRWRGVRAATLQEFDKLKDAADGELVALQGGQEWIDKGGLENAIWLMPIERLIEVIRELIVQREAVKQTIFELTGIADIMRGQTNPNETLGAQQLKSNFGTLRLQRGQNEVQRYARDLMRIKSEIMAEHFSIETLETMTGIVLPRRADQEQVNFLAAQAQTAPPDLGVTWEDVMEVIRPDALRSYRIDVETDSTIRGDLLYQQENAGRFIEGFGAFVTAVGPAVQTGVMPLDVATDLLTAFSRQFKLGKQAEDALARLGSQAEEQGEQGEEGPSQAEIAEQETRRQEAQAQQTQAQADGMKAQSEQAKMQLESQKLELELQKLKQEMADRTEQRALDAQIKRSELALKERELAFKERELSLSDGTERERLVAEAGPGIIETIGAVNTSALAPVAESLQATAAALLIAAQQMSAPKKIVRDKRGRPVGVETETTVNG